MHSKALLLLISIYLSLTTLVYAQQSGAIKGEIRDANSGEAIVFCTVLVESVHKSTYSNDYGNFEITHLKAGTYKILFARTGYKQFTKHVTITGNSTVNLEVLLEENQTQLDEVLIVEQSEATKMETQGFAAKSISTEKVQVQSIQLNNLLDETPGITVRQTGGMGSDASYSINGLTGNAIRFFIDGVPMEYYGSSYSINSLPVSIIEKMEVYKGVVPVELGSDALGGAINITTKNKTDKALDVSYSGGSFNTHQTSISGNYRDEKSGFTFRGSAFYNYSDNNYEVWGKDVYVTDPETGRIDRSVKAKRFNDAYQAYGTKLDIGFTDKKWADQFFISFLASDMYKEVQHGATMEIPYGERYYTQSTVMPSLSYNKKDFLAKGLDVSLFSAYSERTRQVVDTTKNVYNWYGEVWNTKPVGGEQGTPTLAKTDEGTFINRININYALNDNNTVTLNQVFTKFNRVSDDPMAEVGKRALNDEQNMTKNIMGLSLQNRAFDNKLKTNVFGKYYGYSYDNVDAVYENNIYVPYHKSSKDHNYGYGIASSYQLTSDFLVSLSYEKAIRIPKANELFGNDAQNVFATDSLKPEQSQNINLGFRYGTLYFGPHSLTLSTNLFYRDVTDLIQQTTFVTGGQDYFVYENLTSILSKGVDFQVDYNYDSKLDVTFSASYTDARDKAKYDQNGNENLHYNSRLKNEPFFQINSSVRYNFRDVIQEQGNLSVYWTIRYVHEFYRNWESIGKYDKDMIPTQFVNNAGVSYSFPKRKMSLSIDVKNIFNEQVFDNFAIQQPGRGVFMKINYSIF
ncbi:TonB-dependent receptor [Flammeovirga pectinis]|uniref:TonB-dependent receptor n=1 Tax=Flammeovirga pectinis TaxID=2494373 RepID=A0A3Q9FU03_9BACT|nr:TonB-dependent receptor [Flammeovirga pectinis]AZQ65051.1 TonB-dependent receptor [Flammeovirga pectinis]